MRLDAGICHKLRVCGVLSLNLSLKAIYRYNYQLIEFGMRIKMEKLTGFYAT